MNRPLMNRAFVSSALRGLLGYVHRKRRMSDRILKSGCKGQQWRRSDTLFGDSFLRSVPAVIRTWAARSRARRELGELEDHVLADIGISRAEAWLEARKWFWQR
jgi:uncharacterized protein YjiS (DUF1127 family)